ncbi:DNA modification methylase [Porphyromonas gingivalis]|uniref:site-specific DNA-methyltransferase (cytosine-N(4)-specific) n=1 Tax=Porphyromonas gingivalis TaxID=837 RepID=A0AAE9X9G2_PORGN|nr:DNA modification methylase [Porphyromonas gingivalis]WCF99579.1 DNA modification methylase [Porphyromonas gingivalis]
MQFDKNKNVFVYRWYPFVEGYSKEFIEDILGELPFVPTCALEPFCGSGTTPVELQNHGIKCYSFEVSPFMHLLSIVKLVRKYNVDTFEHYVKAVTKKLSYTNRNIRRIESLPFGDTIVKRDQSKKWNFHAPAIDGILDIRHAIRTIVDNDDYKNLFTIALASIIVQASNMFRNGKCLSYKKGWENRIFSRKEIHNFFLDKLNSIFAEDIRFISNQNPSVHNSEICYLGDVRKHLDQVPDGEVDLIITSPPYLNSRDYTDIYMLELKVLQLINSREELRELRKHTLRSHVQIPYDKILPIENERLRNSLLEMSNKELKTWNSDIINMICAYFEDMQLLFSEFAKKMHKGGVVYFNVANSAYYGVEVPVDYIIADIAESCGFKVREIRKARDLKTSPQQSDKIGKLRESVIIIDY